MFASKDYAGEAERVHAIVQARSPGASTLLDVACGTGRHLEHLRRWYDVEGLDLDRAMLERARTRLGEVPLHQADMRGFELGHRFDAVTCLFSSIAQVQTLEGLRTTIACMVRHVRVGGVVIVEPWISPDEHPPDGEPWLATFEEPGMKVAVMETSRLREGVWDEEAHYLVWTGDGLEHLHEQERVGAFTRGDLIGAFEQAGLEVEHDEHGLTGRGLFVGVRR